MIDVGTAPGFNLKLVSRVLSTGGPRFEKEDTGGGFMWLNNVN